MIARSWLFVPADSERKLAKVDGCGADAVILDLEDAVALSRKGEARALAAAFLAERSRETRALQLWVRINPLDGPHAMADLAAVLPGAPDGVMLPKAEGPDDIARLAHGLDALEAAFGLPAVSTMILPVSTETARAPFRLGSYADVPNPRLIGLTWGAEDLSAALGATGNTGPDGRWTSTYWLVRSLTLMGAHAAGVAAIETLHADFRDMDGLRASSELAFSEGFAGRLAIHPAQVAIINAAFTPSPEAIERARAIVAAFAAAPEAGTIGLEGRMLDRPHFHQAQQILKQRQH